MLRFILILAVLGCGDDATSDAGRDAGGDVPTLDASADSGPGDAGAVDSGAADSGPGDAGAMDSGGGGDDAGEPDAPSEMGFGAIAGPCARLAGELASAEPSFYSTRLDFMDDAYDDPEERPMLTEDAVRLLESPNAGGSSQISEAFALEVLVRCEGADLIATENEIEYEPMGSKKTDFLVEMMGGQRIGVSVVRAFMFPLGADYTVARAQEVIGDKLDDILESSANVTEEFEWDKQILAVLAPDDMPLESVMSAWMSFSEERRADTIVYVIVTDGEDEGVYINR
ncbi:MAG: hypothetical protein AB8H86_21240 [Polyangiales bacterium]